MLEDVKQVTIGPLIERTIAKGSVVYTDEYDIYGRLDEWGYDHQTVCHAASEYAKGRRRGWVLRGPCQYARRVLVVVAFVAPPPPGNSPGKFAAVPGVL